MVVLTFSSLGTETVNSLVPEHVAALPFQLHEAAQIEGPSHTPVLSA